MSSKPSGSQPPESFEAYRMRALALLGDRDPMRVLASTPGRLERLILHRSRCVLDLRPGPERWSITEILAHMADAELAISWRFRNMIATPGISLSWWDEHVWSRVLNYQDVRPSASLALFRSLRKSNLDLLRSRSQEQRDAAYGVHEKRGRQSLSDFIRMEAAHDLIHLQRVRIQVG